MNSLNLYNGTQTMDAFINRMHCRCMMEPLNLQNEIWDTGKKNKWQWMCKYGYHLFVFTKQNQKPQEKMRRLTAYCVFFQISEESIAINMSNDLYSFFFHLNVKLRSMHLVILCMCLLHRRKFHFIWNHSMFNLFMGNSNEQHNQTKINQQKRDQWKVEDK